jgi:hypothetical protein
MFRFFKTADFDKVMNPDLIEVILVTQVLSNFLEISFLKKLPMKILVELLGIFYAFKKNCLCLIINENDSYFLLLIWIILFFKIFLVGLKRDPKFNVVMKNKNMNRY